ncbi:hypothetical protein [Helicobacter pylori]|uniref:hypothetical protein n=1 Tax=Helicobacter pylori TaxID=210 RepID=UPI0012E6F1DC|nr:hypothetical protein [Helicobacter pylori]MUU26746.1 hypothetical protein [Helicobacter pylori]
MRALARVIAVSVGVGFFLWGFVAFCGAWAVLVATLQAVLMRALARVIAVSVGVGFFLCGFVAFCGAWAVLVAHACLFNVFYGF